MRILLLTQYYPPETGAPQNRLSDLARRLTKRGHTVTVLTALPSYPRGEIFAGYEGRMGMEEELDGVRVIRTWIYVTRSSAFLKRLLNYLSFAVSSLLAGFFRTGNVDAVVVESPPLFLGLSGILIARFRRAKLIFNVSDLWPESAVALGILHNRFLVRMATALENTIYRASAMITGQTEGILRNIASRFPSKPVVLITNGVAIEHYERLVSGADSGKSRDDNQVFTVGYAGLHGLAQGLEVVLRAAQIVSPYKSIRFEFFGEGPEKARLQKLAVELGLTNVTFNPTYPHEGVPSLLSGFDAFVVPLRNVDLFKGACPSKMFEAMAAGVPIILSIEGEARRLIESAHAGICVRPDSPQAMAVAILKLYRDRVEARRLGQNGRRYVMQHYDRRRIAEDFERELLTVCGAAAS